jgi:hypothetical protein
MRYLMASSSFHNTPHANLVLRLRPTGSSIPDRHVETTRVALNTDRHSTGCTRSDPRRRPRRNTGIEEVVAPDLQAWWELLNKVAGETTSNERLDTLPCSFRRFLSVRHGFAPIQCPERHLWMNLVDEPLPFGSHCFVDLSQLLRQAPRLSADAYASRVPVEVVRFQAR